MPTIAPVGSLRPWEANGVGLGVEELVAVVVVVTRRVGERSGMDGLRASKS